MRVLIIEDNADIARNIGDYCETRGWTVDFALNGFSGLHLAATERFDVIVLDLGLPGMDGLSLCRQLRAQARVETPILMLTARDTLDDKLEGFRAGADDYLVKPFALQELAARVEALTRRRREGANVLRVADLELDPGSFVARRAGRRLDLTPVGLRILRLLLEASPNVVTRGDLEEAIWNGEPPDEATLRSHIYHLRQAIDRPFSLPLLHTVHGIGYRLAVEED
jgi:DNA-binding response OmpR family regulator